MYTFRRLHRFYSYLTFKNFENGSPLNLSKELNVHLTALSSARLLNVSERYELVNTLSHLHRQKCRFSAKYQDVNLILTTN